MPNQAEFWDGLAERYARMPIRDEGAYATSLDRTRGYLKPTDRTLELGCGTGGTARLLAPHVASIMATDISREMIRIARERTVEEGTPNAVFEVADLDANPPSGAPYDVVLAHNLIHLLPEPSRAMAQVASLVRPGGIFISKTPCLAGAGLSLKWRLLLWAVPVMQRLGKAPKLTYLSTGELEGFIARAGFEILEASDYPRMPPSRYIVARRD